MFRLNQWLRRSARGSRRAARGSCPAHLELERLDDRILLSAAVINYQVGSVTHEHVFVRGRDDNLYLDDWNGAKWTWKPLGGSQSILSDPAVINYQVGTVTHENVFVAETDSNGDDNLHLDYWNGVTWTWVNLGNDGYSISPNGAPAAINYQVGSVAHENVFVTGADANLYLDYWNGAKWTWVPLGNDGDELSVTSSPAVINYQVGTVTHENVFAVAGDFAGNTYLSLDYWNGAKWTWQNLGNDGESISPDRIPAVINYQVGSVTHENVFVTGENGKLYLDYWNGAKWTWVNLGNPPASNALDLGTPAVINYQVGSVTHENVFLTGSDGNLYLDYWNGARWTWENLGNRGQSLVSAPAVINYHKVGTTVTRENVFATGSDGNLYLDYWNGATLLPKWTWEPMGNPGVFVDSSLTRTAPGLGVAMLADQGASVSDPGDSAIGERLLLEESPSVGTATNKSSRRSPAVLRPTNHPDLSGDLWSQGLASDPLDW
jgi:hypothetical protein